MRHLRPMWWGLSALMLASCEPKPPEACVEPEADWIDKDEDSYIQADDCRDRNPEVHPLAFDKCDGIDNDCDGEVDEGYPDIDGDGVADCESEELCNGIDDDDDGVIDEGFDDFDGDGVADCLDRECRTVQAREGEIDVDEECSKPVVVVTDPWNLDIEWQHTSPSGDNGVIVMPAIGNLSDDNGDGVIDQGDDPDIVIVNWTTGQVQALRGDGSGVLWTVTGADGNSGVAIADIDNDGEPEVVYAEGVGFGGKTIVAVDHRGREEWRSSFYSSMSYHSTPIVADLEGDGDVEVIFDTVIVEGASGRLQADLGTQSVLWRSPVAADLDNDGTQEILLGLDVYSPTGRKLWSVTPVSVSGDSAFQAVADIDGDAGGESFWVHGEHAMVYDEDGTFIRSFSLPGATSRRPGPPSVADFDGDGDVEIVIPANTNISMYEVDGTRTWSQTMRDLSGIAGASGYDIDGDGAYEVLFADETHFRIYDGTRGTVRYESSSHASGTVFEYPTIADVDADGSAEVVIASNSFGGGTWRGITVFGHNGSGWAEAGPTWPVHDFCVTNINPDGSVPSPAPTPWSIHNVFRARPVVDDVALDLQVEITDACVSSCEPGVGIVALEVQVSNVGGVGAFGGVPVSLFSSDGGALSHIETREVPRIDGAYQVRSMRFEVPVEQTGADGFVVRVDDRGDDPSEINSRYTECDEDNNVDQFPYDVCGPG